MKIVSRCVTSLLNNSTGNKLNVNAVIALNLKKKQKKEKTVKSIERIEKKGGESHSVL